MGHKSAQKAKSKMCSPRIFKAESLAQRESKRCVNELRNDVTRFAAETVL